MTRGKIVLCILIAILLCSCGSNKKSNNEKFDPNVWTDNFTYEQTSTNGEETISIPYVEKNGVKYIAVKINGGPTFDMIVDTGCSGVLISIQTIYPHLCYWEMESLIEYPLSQLIMLISK